MSGDGQKATLILLTAKNFGLIAAALLSLAGLRFISAWILYATVAALVLALVAETVNTVLKPAERWYQGRAIAESAKTLAWKYTVGAEPFGYGLNQDPKAVLHERLSELARYADDSVVIDSGHLGSTEKMDEVRDCSLEVRKEVYLRDRIKDQHAWYASKAELNRCRAKTWSFLLIALEAIAIALSVIQVYYEWSAPVTPLITTIVACIGSWVAIKQFSNLAAAYTTAANEISLVERTVKKANSESWGNVVSEAEDAISREHTMWLASRNWQGPPTPR